MEMRPLSEIPARRANGDNTMIQSFCNYIDWNETCSEYLQTFY